MKSEISPAMLHSPDHSLSSIAYGSGQLHTQSPSPSPSPSHSHSHSHSQSSSLPHFVAESPCPQVPLSSSPPSPPLPPDLASFDDLDAVRETIMEVELSSRLWLKAHRAATQPKDYNIPWINQVSQSLCRTMSWRKTLHFLEEQKNTPKPSSTPTPPSPPPLVPIQLRALECLTYEKLLPFKPYLDAQGISIDSLNYKGKPQPAPSPDSESLEEPSSTGSADVPSATAPAPQPASVPRENPGPPLGPRTSPSAAAPADELASASLENPVLPLGARTSPSAPAPTFQSASALLENATPAPPLSQAASPTPDRQSATVSSSDASGCATIRAVPVCPTLHRLLPATPDAPSSPSEFDMESPSPSPSCSPSAVASSSQSRSRSQSHSASTPTPSTYNPWFNKPFPAPDTPDTPDDTDNPTPTIAPNSS